MSYFSCFFNGVTETLGYFLFLISYFDSFYSRKRLMLLTLPLAKVTCYYRLRNDSEILSRKEK